MDCVDVRIAPWPSRSSSLRALRSTSLEPSPPASRPSQNLILLAVVVGYGRPQPSCRLYGRETSVNGGKDAAVVCESSPEADEACLEDADICPESFLEVAIFLLYKRMR